MSKLKDYFESKKQMDNEALDFKYREETELEEKCEYCGGTGELDCMDAVYPGEPHMAMVGTRKCVCQDKNDEDYYD
jgi:hypothetical protein